MTFSVFKVRLLELSVNHNGRRDHKPRFALRRRVPLCPGPIGAPNMLQELDVPDRFRKVGQAVPALSSPVASHMPRHRPPVRAYGTALVGLLLLASPLLGQEDVSFPTRDGGVVYGTLAGRGGHAVLLAHGGRFTKESWTDQARTLNEAGFRTLAIDFRGRGDSRGGPAPGATDSVHLDVMAGVAFLHERGAERVSIVGASFGGWAAGRAVAELPPGAIDRLVLLAHAPIEEPERLHGDKLFITAREDRSGSGALRLPDIRDQYERAPEPKKLVVLEGSAHGQYVFATEQGSRLMAEIVTFLTDG